MRPHKAHTYMLHTYMLHHALHTTAHSIHYTLQHTLHITCRTLHTTHYTPRTPLLLSPWCPGVVLVVAAGGTPASCPGPLWTGGQPPPSGAATSRTPPSSPRTLLAPPAAGRAGGPGVAPSEGAAAGVAVGVGAPGERPLSQVPCLGCGTVAVFGKTCQPPPPPPPTPPPPFPVPLSPPFVFDQQCMRVLYHSNFQHRQQQQVLNSQRLEINPGHKSRQRAAHGLTCIHSLCRWV